MASLIIVLPSLIFLFDAGNQIGHGIDLKRLRDRRLRLRLNGAGLLLGRIRRLTGRDEGGRLGLRRRQERSFLGALAAEASP